MIEQEITLLTNGRISFQKCGNGLQFGYSKNRGVYSIKVKTSGEWNGLTIRAFWHIPDIKEPITSLLVDNVIKVPALVTSYKGEGRIVFEGSDGTKTVTSADVRYYVNKNSGTCDGTIPEPGTPAWQELVGTVKKYSDIAVEAKESAKKSADEAKHALEDTKDVKSQAIEDMNSSKTAVIEEIENKKNLSIEEINSVKEDAKGELETLCDSTRDFANQAKEAADRAKASELAAKDSELKSKESERLASEYKNSANESANSALKSEENASISESNATEAANRALISENNAKLSETASDNSSKKAFDSETKAKASEINSSNNAVNAENSAINAAASADAAKGSEDKAKTSEIISTANTAEVAKNLETVRDIKAEIDILDANVSANAASSNENANNARISAEAAKQSEPNAASSEASALESKNASAENVVKSQNNASNAKNSADSAKESETRSQEYSNLSQSNANASSESASNAKKSEVSAKASEDASKKNADDSAATLQELKDGIASGNFKGEKGDKGDPGPAGADGKDAIIDSTLTHEGEAADAKATGDAISAVKARQNVLIGTETGNPIAVDDAFSAPLCGLTVYGRSTQDGTPTPDAPVPIVSAGDSGNIAVKVTGKNLFPVITNDNISTLNKPTGGKRYGYVFHVPAESRVTISGNANISTNCLVGDFDIKTQTYTQKAQLISEKGGTYATTLQSGWYAVYLANDYLPTILIKLNDAKIQIEIGTKATAYEPYHEQLLTLQTPNGLPGIPVTSGGNYTDQNGQQWVCDEVDLERGVKVQRVKSRRILSSEVNDALLGVSSCYIIEQNIARPANNRQIGHLMCTHLECVSWSSAVDNGVQGICAISNQPYIGITIQGLKSANEYKDFIDKNEVGIAYQLAAPIETPLTPAEIAAYKALVTYGPDTVVQAGDGAGLKLDYQRDVNIAIKKLEDAIASMTTT